MEAPMEAPINKTQLLLKTHTSTDGSVSPKPRWSRGVPPMFEEGAAADKPAEKSTTPTTTASTSDAEEAPPSPPSLRPGGSKSNASNVSSAGSKSYVAWRSLVEDEADSEPKLQKPTEGGSSNPLVLPEFLDGGRELLCRHVELRLREVDRQSSDISALVDEYLRFMYLRQRLEGMLTLDPSPLVDDVWQAHITLESDYAGFCERLFGEERLEYGVPHREIDLSHPVLYENTVGAYEHFFGACPPADFWPKASAVTEPALDGEEGEETVDISGRRAAFVRSAEKHFHFSEE